MGIASLKTEYRKSLKQDFREDLIISIVIPVFNLQDHIEKCLESVLTQTYKVLQIILIDDGSTDNSYEICKQYEQKDERIMVLHQENRGVSAARNAGLKEALGQFVMFIDGDDTIAPDYVEAYLSQAQSNGSDIVIGGFTKKENSVESQIAPISSQYNTKDFFSLLCKEGTELYGYVCCKFYRLSLLKENALFFNEKMHSQEDLDFALSAYGKAKSICCFENYGYYYEYVPSTRKASAEHILGNQVKLYNIAKNAGADTKALIPRFQSVLYTWLFHAKSVSEVTDIINMEIPDDLLIKVNDQRREVQRIIKSFRDKKAASIFKYFSIRGKLKLVLLKMHAIKSK